jgi:hypothetical protein
MKLWGTTIWWSRGLQRSYVSWRSATCFNFRKEGKTDAESTTILLACFIPKCRYSRRHHITANGKNNVCGNRWKIRRKWGRTLSWHSRERWHQIRVKVQHFLCEISCSFLHMERCRVWSSFLRVQTGNVPMSPYPVFPHISDFWHHLLIEKCQHVVLERFQCLQILFSDAFKANTLITIYIFFQDCPWEWSYCKLPPTPQQRIIILLSQKSRVRFRHRSQKLQHVWNWKATTVPTLG